MSPDEFHGFLRERLGTDTAELIRGAREHYLRAAALLEIKTPAVARLESPEWYEGVQAWMAYNAVAALQERYAANLYTPQIGFWDSTDQQQDSKWVRYLHHELKPALLDRPEFIRTLLRCVGLLPSASQADSEVALGLLAREFPMPRIPVETEPATPDR